MKFVRSVVSYLFCGIVSVSGSEQNIDTLLSDYAQKADLSEQTRKESAGFLQVYTRQDLERMQIHQLLELIEKIPFFRYKEDNYGLTNPFYEPYQPPIPNSIRVYINDRAITGVFTNDGLRIFGQMNMTTIDHVEVYLGMPSQNFGIEGAYYVLKLYTKDPKRENTTLAGAILGSRGTTSLYGYQAAQNDTFNYIAYGNYTNLQRKEVVTQDGNRLKRDKEYLNAYGEIRTQNHHFEMQAITGKADAFMGDSPDLKSIDPYFDFDYVYGGWYYEDQGSGWKAFANITYTTSKYHDQTQPPYPLGFYKTQTDPYIAFYYEDNSRIDETFADMQVKKNFQTETFKSNSGLQVRYKHFKFIDKPYPTSNDYNQQWLLSAFSENSYLFNTNHMVIGSFKVDRSIDNGKIEDRTLLSGRIGYIYNSHFWTSKTFAMYTDAAPVMQTYYVNRYYFNQEQDPDIEHGYGVATQLIFHPNTTHRASLMISQMYRENALFLNVENPQEPFYDNMPEKMAFTTFMLEYSYLFSPLSKIELNIWQSINSYANNLQDTNTYGGVLSYTTSLNRYDFHTDLVYKDYDSMEDAGFDLNLALTYHYSRVLTLFLKGNNILGEALKQNYYVYNPLNDTKTTLPNVDVIDRRFWLGMEYQF